MLCFLRILVQEIFKKLRKNTLGLKAACWALDLKAKDSLKLGKLKQGSKFLFGCFVDVLLTNWSSDRNFLNKLFN